jgi:hypothetical protein
VALGLVDSVARTRGAQTFEIVGRERLGRESLEDSSVERGHSQAAALGADEDRRLACPQHDPGRLLRFNQREQRVDGRHA